MLVKDKTEISQELYKKIKNSDYEASREMMIGVAIKSGYNPAGYGFFRPHVTECANNGKPYKWIFEWEHYDSCD